MGALCPGHTWEHHILGRADSKSTVSWAGTSRAHQKWLRGLGLTLIPGHPRREWVPLTGRQLCRAQPMFWIPLAALPSLAAASLMLPHQRPRRLRGLGPSVI